MKVSKTGSVKGSTAVGGKKKVSATGPAFSDSLKNVQGTSEAAPLVDAQGVGSVDALLSVQETVVESDHHSRTQARAYGDDLLTRLDELRIGIIDGHFSKEKLTGLAGRLRQKRQLSDDPVLNQLIDEIELRAEVEIAKLTRSH